MSNNPNQDVKVGQDRLTLIIFGSFGSQAPGLPLDMWIISETAQIEKETACKQTFVMVFVDAVPYLPRSLNRAGSCAWRLSLAGEMVVWTAQLSIAAVAGGTCGAAQDMQNILAFNLNGS
jgi:hypothetical protein